MHIGTIRRPTVRVYLTVLLLCLSPAVLQAQEVSPPSGPLYLMGGAEPRVLSHHAPETNPTDSVVGAFRLERRPRVGTGRTALGVGLIVVGTAGVGAGVYGGVLSVSLLEEGATGEGFESLALMGGAVLLVPSLGIAALGIWAIAQGVRVLHGKDLRRPYWHQEGPSGAASSVSLLSISF